MGNQRFIQIDEEGFLHSDGVRVADAEYGHHLLSQIEMDDFGGFTTTFSGAKIIVEAFDAPLVIKQIHREPGLIWTAQCSYELKIKIDMNTLCVDEWDRFYCYNNLKIPMVFNRSAQADLFNIVDDYDDDSLSIDGQKLVLPPFLKASTDTRPPSFWDQKYIEKETPGWELNEPSPLLISSLSQLKVPKSRVLVPGCGTGNDAAFLAEQGHIVTAVDFSKEALKRAQTKYGHIKNLKFVQADILSLDSSYTKGFDLIFDHTSFCAIPLDQRSNMVNVWLKCLDDGGLILGIFFVMQRLHSPPFGGSEWEYRQRMKKNFQQLYWTRWKDDTSWRLGKELLIYARKTN